MKKINREILCIILMLVSLPIYPKVILEQPLYIVTAADEQFFPCLINFIGAIHRVNFNELGEISVFNLGLNQKQIQELKKIEKVNIYSVEMTHPELLTRFVARPNGKKWARGWFAWKPVIIKQALEMFPQILYIDAGVMVLKPLNNLFKHIKQQGYFFIDCGHSIDVMTTGYVRKKLNLESENRKWLLDPATLGIWAGFQGLTRKLFNSYVIPLYELTKNLKYFQDDGSAPWGFGGARHDQTLVSIYGRLLNLEVFSSSKTCYLDVDNKKISFSLGSDLARYGLELIHEAPKFTEYIKYKN